MNDYLCVAVAIRSICQGYVAQLANERYIELLAALGNDDTLRRLLVLAGRTLVKEQEALHNDIMRDLQSDDGTWAYFDDYRFCMTDSKSMLTAVCKLMGW